MILLGRYSPVLECGQRHAWYRWARHTFNALFLPADGVVMARWRRQMLSRWKIRPVKCCFGQLKWVLIGSAIALVLNCDLDWRSSSGRCKLLLLVFWCRNEVSRYRNEDSAT